MARKYTSCCKIAGNKAGKLAAKTVKTVNQALELSLQPLELVLAFCAFLGICPFHLSFPIC